MMFIPGNVPSLKNSKIKTAKGIFPSKTVVKYLRNQGILQYSVSKKIVKGYKTRCNLFRAVFVDEKWVKPTNTSVIGIHFVRGSRHRFDFHNAVQIIADLMVAHDFIEDDDMDWFIPMPMMIGEKWYTYDKENPGVFLKVLKRTKK